MIKQGRYALGLYNAQHRSASHVTLTLTALTGQKMSGSSPLVLNFPTSCFSETLRG